MQFWCPLVSHYPYQSCKKLFLKCFEHSLLCMRYKILLRYICRLLKITIFKSRQHFFFCEKIQVMHHTKQGTLWFYEQAYEAKFFTVHCTFKTLFAYWIPGNHRFGEYILVGFCVCFLCGIVSVFKLCFDSYECTSNASHERPFHKRNRLLFSLRGPDSQEVFFSHDFRFMKLFLFC